MFKQSLSNEINVVGSGTKRGSLIKDDGVKRATRRTVSFAWLFGRTFEDGSDQAEKLKRPETRESLQERIQQLHAKKTEYLTKKRFFFRNIARGFLYNETKNPGNVASSSTSDTRPDQFAKTSRQTPRKGTKNLCNELLNDPKEDSEQGDEVLITKERLLLNRLLLSGSRMGVTEEEFEGGCQITKKHLAPLKDNFSLTNTLTESTDYHPQKDEFTSQSVLLANIPIYTSIPAILAQIGGGPLERIQLLNRKNWSLMDIAQSKLQHIDWSRTVLKLDFDNRECALAFWEFSKSQAFIVNGHHITAFQLPDLHQVNDKLSSLPLESQKYSGEITRELMEEPEKARRILVLKKPIASKRKISSRKHYSYPDPELNFSRDFNVDEILEDFSRFGNVVEITPVISRKLCFGIQYFDVASAIAAKHTIEGDIKNENSFGDEFWQKYHDWYIWYGKDPTEKSILV